MLGVVQDFWLGIARAVITFDGVKSPVIVWTVDGEGRHC